MLRHFWLCVHRDAVPLRCRSEEYINFSKVIIRSIEAVSNVVARGCMGGEGQREIVIKPSAVMIWEEFV